MPNRNRSFVAKKILTLATAGSLLALSNSALAAYPSVRFPGLFPSRPVVPWMLLPARWVKP